MQTSLVPREEHDQANNGGNEPKKHVDKVKPDGRLHSLNSTIVLRVVIVNVFLPEYTKDCGPENAVDCSVHLKCTTLRGRGTGTHKSIVSHPKANPWSLPRKAA